MKPSKLFDSITKQKGPFQPSFARLLLLGPVVVLVVVVTGTVSAVTVVVVTAAIGSVPSVATPIPSTISTAAAAAAAAVSIDQRAGLAVAARTAAHCFGLVQAR